MAPELNGVANKILTLVYPKQIDKSMLMIGLGRVAVI